MVRPLTIVVTNELEAMAEPQPGFELCIFDDTGFRVDAKLKLHDIATGRCTDQAGTHIVVICPVSPHSVDSRSG